MVGLLIMIVQVGCSKVVDQAETYSIMVVPKGQTHEFWLSVRVGAEAFADELAMKGVAVGIIWEGPLEENDVDQQISIVNSCLNREVDGLVLAPLDDQALVEPVERLQGSGLPTVIIDSGLNSEAIVSFVATDNRKGGRLAAETMGELLEGKGNVLMLRYQKGSASTHDREESFIETLRSMYPAVALVASDRYGGPTRQAAKTASIELLKEFGKTTHGVFCPNESTSIGMLLALQELGHPGGLSFVGFDATDLLAKALSQGRIQALVVQDPFEIGYQGLKAMIDHLSGRPVEKRIRTGVSLLRTRDAQTEIGGEQDSSQ